MCVVMTNIIIVAWFVFFLRGEQHGKKKCKHAKEKYFPKNQKRDQSQSRTPAEAPAIWRPDTPVIGLVL
jgi:hypothetical protein